MAINYSVYTDLDLEVLQHKLEAHAKRATEVWELWGVSDDLGPFHAEIMQDEHDIDRGFKSEAWTRLSKDRISEATDSLMDFYRSLPGRRLVLMDDRFIAFSDGQPSE